MIELMHHQTVRCELDGTRTYDRCAGICYVDGVDISKVLVCQGLARDCPRFSEGRYAKAERRGAADGWTIAGPTRYRSIAGHAETRSADRNCSGLRTRDNGGDAAQARITPCPRPRLV